MLVLIALVWVLPSAAAKGATPRANAAMLGELNAMRASNGLPGLRLAPRMSRDAAAYARSMARTQLLGHGAWDQRVARSSGRSAHIGEVIGWLARATAAREASWLVQSWLASPVHRAVLLDPSFRRIGVGRAVGTLGGTRSAIYTIDFAAAR